MTTLRIDLDQFELVPDEIEASLVTGRSFTRSNLMANLQVLSLKSQLKQISKFCAQLRSPLARPSSCPSPALVPRLLSSGSNTKRQWPKQLGSNDNQQIKCNIKHGNAF
jgi:hypothetical protein